MFLDGNSGNIVAVVSSIRPKQGRAIMDRMHRRGLLVIAAMASGVTAAVGQVPHKASAEGETLSPGQTVGIVGQHVRDADGAAAGRLWDVLVDASGEPRAAIIDYGGVLGVGRRKVAIAWSAVTFTPSDAAHPIRLLLTRQQLGALPSFSYGSAPVRLGASR